MSVYIKALKAKEARGLPIVLLHGWGRTGEDFRELSQGLATSRDVYVVDLPGFGNSPIPKELAGIVEYADMIVSSLALERFILLGHSVGGKIACVIAAKYQNIVDKLILLDASGLPRQRTTVQKLKIKFINFLRAAIKLSDRYCKTALFEKWFIPRFASPDYKNAGPLKNIFVKIVNESVARFLPRVQCPVLLLWGENDIETPLDVARSFTTKLANSKLVILPGVGHSPHTEGSVQLIEYSVEKFLGENQ